jgi:formate hydrogenlyase subunit 4
MNLLSLILITMALIVGACVFYVAWELSSGKYEISTSAAAEKEEPDESKESKDSPGP